MRKNSAKIGAIIYILWGILHIIGGGYMLAEADPGAQLGMLSSHNVSGSLPSEMGTIIHASLSFHAFNLLWLGALALAVAVTLNWKNDHIGYWLNLSVVAAADIGMIIFLLLPGHLAIAEAFPGPVLWFLAAAFSTMGILEDRAKPQSIR